MKTLRFVLVALVAMALLPGGAAAKPVTVWEDGANDAGPDTTGPAPVFTEGGFDIVSGAINKAGANLEFVVTHAAMPPGGSLQEGFRFLWAFNVGGKDYRITAKTADIGKPDLLAGETDERVGQVDPQGHFRLEGNCQAGEQVGILIPINCEPLAYVEGAFDPAAKTLTVIVPMKLVKAKAGRVIMQGGGDAAGICTICWVSHTAERSHSGTIIDTAIQTKAYKIPK